MPVGRSTCRPGFAGRPRRFQIRVADASGSSTSTARWRLCNHRIWISGRRVARRFGSPSQRKTWALRGRSRGSGRASSRSNASKHTGSKTCIIPSTLARLYGHDGSRTVLNRTGQLREHTGATARSQREDQNRQGRTETNGYPTHNWGSSTCSRRAGSLSRARPHSTSGPKKSRV